MGSAMSGGWRFSVSYISPDPIEPKRGKSLWSSLVEELCKLFALPEKRLETSFTFAWATGLEAPATKKPHAPVTGNGVGRMVGFPRPGYLRRRRMRASPPSPRRAAEEGSGMTVRVTEFRSNWVVLSWAPAMK